MEINSPYDYAHIQNICDCFAYWILKNRTQSQWFLISSLDVHSSSHSYTSRQLHLRYDYRTHS